MKSRSRKLLTLNLMTLATNIIFYFYWTQIRLSEHKVIEKVPMKKTRDMKEEIHPDISIDSSATNTKFNDKILQNLIPSFTADILQPRIIFGRNVNSSRTSSGNDTSHSDNINDIKISIGISSIYRTNNNMNFTSK